MDSLDVRQGSDEHVALVTRLAHVIAGLNADLDLPTLLQRISDSSRSLLQGDFAAYAVIDGSDFVISAVSDLSQRLLGQRVPIGESAVGTLIAEGTPSIVCNQASYPNSSLLLSEHLAEFRLMAVALTHVAGEPVGAQYVMFRDGGRFVTPEEIAVLELFAEAAGTALANASAYAEVVGQREHERAVIDATVDGMAVIGASGLVRHWNPAAQRITGLSPADIIGRPLPFPCAEVGSKTAHKLPTGTWIEVACAPIGITGEYVVDIHDITPSKHLEEAKDFFLAVASHELRTPITVIQGFAATLTAHWEQLTDDDRRDAAGRIAERAKALASLVEQLLLGSRAGAADFQVHLVPFELAGLLQTAVSGFQALSRTHTLSLDVPPHLPPVFGDPSATEIVIGQLIENAVKYSPEGGHVQVQARCRDGRMEITVADEGIGLGDVDPERLFDRFYQSSADDRRRFGGVGLGLYIVRRLVEAQHGTIAARSRKTRGSVFEVTLPLA